MIGRIIAELIGSGYVSTAALMVLSVVSCSATITGVGEITTASHLDLPVDIFASIDGSGSVEIAALKSISVLVSSMTGSGTITQAQIVTLSSFITEILGQGTVVAVAFSKCFMSSDITSAGDLVTAQSCAQAVWSAVAAAFNDAGTMGNKMNSASAAGDPWTAEIPGTYTVGSAGELLKRIEKIIKDNQAFILGS